MREDVIRQIVTRVMSEPGFLDNFLRAPGEVFSHYQLRADEIDVLRLQLGGAGSSTLEPRISASLTRPMMADETPDWCKKSSCGCKCCTPTRDCQVCAPSLTQ